MAFAGVSLIADGRLCTSTESVVDSGADSGYHLLVAEGYSRTKETTPNREWIQSRPFIVGGRRWKVLYYPNDFGCDCSFFGGSDHQEFISLLLAYDEYLINEVKAHVAFSFIGQPELRVPNLIRQKHPCCFYDGCCFTDHQRGEFLTREAFEASSHVKNDSFVIRCDVIVLERNDEDDDEDYYEEEEHQRARPFIKLPPSDLPSNFSDLLLSKDGADITFQVGGKKLAAHRSVLAARSTVFKKQLFGAMDKGTPAPSVVKIDGIEANVFEGLLTFIYTDGMPDYENLDWLLQLLEAPERYDLQKLKLICEEKFANLIFEDRVADIIVMAEQRRCRWLKEACLGFIKTHTSLHRAFTADSFRSFLLCILGLSEV